MQTQLSYTIAELKAQLFSHYDEEGSHCPVCGHYVKLYHRKLTSTMAIALIYIYRYFVLHPEKKWVHIEKLFKNIKDIPAHDTSVLRHWGLLEKKGTMKEDGNPDCGYYGITEKGKLFVNNKATVKKHVNLYNNEVVDFEGDEIRIEDALSQKFHYNELMEKEIEGLEIKVD